MPQRMDAGKGELEGVTSGVLLAALGAIVVLGAVFLDRADDYFYEVADNRLLEYSFFGPVMIGLLLAAVASMALSLKRKAEVIGPAVLLLVSLALLALAIVASQDLGTHATDMGYVDNEPEAGTIFSIVGSGLMVVGSLLALWGSFRAAKRPGDQPL